MRFWRWVYVTFRWFIAVGLVFWGLGMIFTLVAPIFLPDGRVSLAVMKGWISSISMIPVWSGKYMDSTGSFLIHFFLAGGFIGVGAGMIRRLLQKERRSETPLTAGPETASGREADVGAVNFKPDPKAWDRYAALAAKEGLSPQEMLKRSIQEIVEGTEKRER